MLIYQTRITNRDRAYVPFMVSGVVLGAILAAHLLKLIEISQSSTWLLFVILFLVILVEGFLIANKRLKLIITQNKDGQKYLSIKKGSETLQQFSFPLKSTIWWNYEYSGRGSYRRSNYVIQLEIKDDDKQTIQLVESLAPWRSVPKNVPYQAKKFDEDALVYEAGGLQRLHGIILNG